MTNSLSEMENKSDTSPIPKTSDGGNHGHLLLIPYPLPGHMKSFTKLTHILADQETKVTLLVPESTYIQTVLEFENQPPNRVRLVSIPDGLRDGRADVTANEVMFGYLGNLVEEANGDGCDCDERFECVIADATFGWAPDIGEKMRFKYALLFTSSPGTLALIVKIPELIEAGIINADGSPTSDEKITLSPNLPPLLPSELPWTHPHNPSLQKPMFSCIYSMHHTLRSASHVLCNWLIDLDPHVPSILPNTVPIGPLLTAPRTHRTDDFTCLGWLDKHPPGSVVYVAFGSSARFSQNQLTELAHGLELAGRPFLWVVRSDQAVDYPEGFPERTVRTGRIVEWAPQEAVLSHASVACYVTHCGWNSTVEALAYGVPLLCWPYFADQLYNRTCVCGSWGTGAWLRPDENGVVSREEIKARIDEVVGDEVLRGKVRRWKEAAVESVGEGGSSWRNLRKFLDEVRSG